MMVDYDVMKAAKLSKYPFEWVELKDILSKEDRHTLAHYYPYQQLQPAKKYSDDVVSDKSYLFSVLPLVRMNEHLPSLQKINSVWVKLIQRLDCESYRSLVSNLVDIDLMKKPMDISLFCFAENAWVSPHTDKNNKLVSQIFYFNEYWEPEWGGYMHLLTKNNKDAIYKRVSPSDNVSILFKRSESSWHSVQPVTSAAKQARITLQCEFWNQEEDI